MDPDIQRRLSVVAKLALSLLAAAVVLTVVVGAIWIFTSTSVVPSDEDLQRIDEQLRPCESQISRMYALPDLATNGNTSGLVIVVSPIDALDGCFDSRAPVGGNEFSLTIVDDEFATRVVEEDAGHVEPGEAGYSIAARAEQLASSDDSIVLGYSKLGEASGEPLDLCTEIQPTLCGSGGE